MPDTPSLFGFAPALALAVEQQLRQGVAIGDIEDLAVYGAASLRGVQQLTGLKTLTVEHGSCLRQLRGHPTLSGLSVISRGWHKRLVDLEPVAQLPALRDLLLVNLRLRDLRPLCACALQTVTLSSCDVRAQRLPLPPSLVELIIDSTAGLRLRGVCPNLRKVDLWGTSMEPVPWIALQPAVEELWLVGCSVPTLDPLLAMQRPPMWIFMDGDVEADLTSHRATITRLEASGARFALGPSHEIGIWIPGGDLSEHQQEPLYLSPGWPRS